MLTLFALGAMLAGASHRAAAQFSIGGHVGAELDNEEDYLLFGLEARFPLRTSMPVIIQPRFTYHPFDGGKIMQLDANVIHELDLAHPGKVRPYIGAGGAFTRLSIDDVETPVGEVGGDSESKVGLNLITGARFQLAPDSPLEPFVHAQYTIEQDFPNSFTIVAGLSFRVGGGGARGSSGGGAATAPASQPAATPPAKTPAKAPPKKKPFA